MNDSTQFENGFSIGTPQEKTVENEATMFVPETAQAETGDANFVSMRKWLKKNTKIHGWLSFFLFMLSLGAGITLFQSIVGYKAEAEDVTQTIALGDLLFAVAVVAIGICTVYNFSERKSNAVFYARAYLLILAITNIFVIVVGGYEKDGPNNLIVLVRGIFWAVIWLFYLQFSKQVAEVIPKHYRNVSAMDWCFVSCAIAIPIIFFVIGLSKMIKEEIASSVTPSFLQVNLKSDERTDGRVCWKIPNGFKCDEHQVEVAKGQYQKLFQLENDSIGNCTVVSDFDNNTSWTNFEEYFTNWEDSDASSLPNRKIDGGEKSINGNKCLYRVTEYSLDNALVYWHFYLLFNEKTEKVVLLSAYNSGEDSYIQELLQSVRFE